jgi:hypothetical protein
MELSRLLARSGWALLFSCALSTAQTQPPTLEPIQQLEPQDAEVFPTDDQLVPVGFGTDIAIEGNRALISMSGADRDAGRIAVFRRAASGEWTRVGRLRFRDTPNGVRFVELRNGIAVVASDDTVYVARPGSWTAVPQFNVDSGDVIQSLSYDGHTAVVGASSGVYSFTITRDTVARQQKISSPRGMPSDAFGSAVSVFGNTLVVGSPGYNDGQGAVYVYRFDGTRWVEAQMLLAADGEAGDGFGAALAVRHGIIVVGAPNADAEYAGEFEELVRMGAAFVFAPRANRWIQTQKVSPADDGVENFLSFGTHIEINSGRVMVGAPGFSGLTFEQGALYVYERQGSRLHALAHAIDGNELGYSFAAWGNTLIAGLVEPSFYTGRALVYDLGTVAP